MSHLLRHGTSVFKVISERPVILPSECRVHGKDAVIPILNVLDLTRPARAGLELKTYRLLSESTTARLRQPVKKSASYEYKNKFANKGAQLVPIVIPTD
jgi:hypothetical protein